MKKKFSFLVLFLSTIYYLLSTTSVAYAQEPETWGGNCVTEGDVATIQGLECLFVNIVRILIPLAGLALFIMLIIGSFQMLTAGGEAKEIQKARKTLTSAIFGFVLFLGIWFILRLIQQITGVNVLKFEIPK